jgi:DNA-binding transcriptional MerR regulator
MAMKMLEACRRTGLTEKTIRFYIEKGLIAPDTQRINERTYIDFEESDILRLRRVAALRKAGFSIESILEMTRSPGRVRPIVEGHIHGLRSELRQRRLVLDALGELRDRELKSVDELADGLIRSIARASLPPTDTKPDFFRFDGMTESEREKALIDFEREQQRMVRTGRAIVFTIATLNAVGAIVSAFSNFNFFTLVMQLALSVALYAGVSWVRAYFAASAVFIAFVSLAMLMTAGQSGAPVPPGAVAFLIGHAAYSVASGVILFKSKSVSEFLYMQKNG